MSTETVKASSLHPNQLKLLRVQGAITSAVLMVPAIVFNRVADDAPVPDWLPLAIVAGLALLLILVLPGRRYRSWGYESGEDELHIQHGVWVRVRTAVPFGRVQHIDVSQGPLQRVFGLGTLILHTAGTRSAAVPLPGLLHGEAEAMRDRIREKIRQDLA